ELHGFLRQPETHPVVVRAALARLAGRWNDGRITALLAAFLDDASPQVQADALRSLQARTDVPLDAATLRRLATSSDARVRTETVPLALRLGDATLLDALAADGDARVRWRLASELSEQ